MFIKRNCRITSKPEEKILCFFYLVCIACLLIILDTNMTIHTLPWGQNGYKDIGRANSYANNYASITQHAGSYFYSSDLRG